MSAEWRQRLEESNKAFLEVVWPIIKEVCGAGQIKPVEVIEDNDLAHDMDVKCGIDIWQTVEGEGCRGIASRVQWNKNFKTFTIRKEKTNGMKTEYEKRKKAIESGSYIYPYLTCQAYIKKEGFVLMGGAIARTTDIFRAIERNYFQIRKTIDASFYAVAFKNVEHAQEFNATGMK